MNLAKTPETNINLMGFPTFLGERIRPKIKGTDLFQDVWEVNDRFTITSHTNIGLPLLSDGKILFLMITLYMQERSSIINLGSLSDICRNIGMAPQQKNLDSVRDSLQRWQHVVYYFKNFYSRSKFDVQSGYRGEVKSLKVISAINGEAQRRDAVLRKGESPWAFTNHIQVTLDRDFVDALEDDFRRSFSFHVLRDCKKGIEARIYLYLLPKFKKADVFSVRLDTLLEGLGRIRKSDSIYEEIYQIQKSLAAVSEQSLDKTKEFDISLSLERPTEELAYLKFIRTGKGDRGVIRKNPKIVFRKN